MVRTRHLTPDGRPQFSNRLATETSPYLLQHAHNPVDWYPWGSEAFEEARRRRVPVLLSIGYSTCHWCHVMEEESFEDLEVARLMNEKYVCIKVDREERPDVDAIYMAAVQAISGQGGWPMTVWLNHEREPFFAGTYFPARDGDRGAATGFMSLLQQIRDIYDRDPNKVASTSRELADFIQQSLTHQGNPVGLRPDALENAVQYYRNRFDPVEGGVGRAPKFPSSLPIRLLLRSHTVAGDDAVLEMAVMTLEKMAGGGMYDHVAGGFHRYSVDSEWLVPHFEKMLYDNAQLALAYLEAYQVTGRSDFSRVAQEVLFYVEREMTSPAGAFYSATDADSLGPNGQAQEGYFFTWTPAELGDLLNETEVRLIRAYYGVTDHGNFEHRNILHTARSARDVAQELGLEIGLFWKTLNEAREKLFQARRQRPQPLRDEKVIAAWNGLMISSYAQAGLILDNEHHLDVALKAAAFIYDQMRLNGRLQRTFNNGQARLEAYLEDYAFVTAAFLDLFEATGDSLWLDRACEFDEVVESDFEDIEKGGFFRTSHSHEKLIAREKPIYDGAEPSGNSVTVMNLLRLAEFTGRDSYRQRADRTLAFFGEIINASPAAVSELLLAVGFRQARVKQIVIVPGRENSQEMLNELRKTFVPYRIFVRVNEKTKPIALIEGKQATDGRTTAYVCESGVCKLPTTDPHALTSLLRS